uniref:SAGA-associated factor 11 n=1 Tax=Meloidogyne hapla TaxID=6305 RepID=A0A1I8BZJ5_MELHA
MLLNNSNCVNIVLSIKRNLVEALGLLIIGEMAEFIQPENGFNYCSNCDKHIDVGLAANNWKLHFQKCEGVKNKRKLETDEDEESEKTKKKK